MYEAISFTLQKGCLNVLVRLKQTEFVKPLHPFKAAVDTGTTSWKVERYQTQCIS